MVLACVLVVRMYLDGKAFRREDQLDEKRADPGEVVADG
jgi:hypothetical protein